MTNKRKTFMFFLQLALWLVFISLPYFMVPHQNDTTTVEEFLKRYSPQPDLPQNILLSSLAFNLFLIAFFYLHHYIFFDRLVVPRRYTAYISLLVIAFVFIFLSSWYIKKHFFDAVPAINHPIAIRDFIRAFTWYLLVLLASLGLKFLSQWQKAEERAKEIENEQLRTELSFLHAQINPHFLFNSLNTIYSLALKKSDAAPQAVLKLSHLLRYVIDDASREKVSLDQEVNNLNNYIELQKLRSTSTLKVNFTIEGEISSACVAPLLLLPFVENAFKYGISNHEESPIDILLRREKNHFNFTITNRKFENTERHSTGIGIANVQRRLTLLYPDKHKLEIQDTGTHYSINLMIQFA